MDGSNGFNMQTWSIDYDYMRTLGMEIIRAEIFPPSTEAIHQQSLSMKQQPKYWDMTIRLGRKCMHQMNKIQDNPKYLISLEW